MNALLRALPRALAAEALKLRGTLALWMCLIAPATVVGLYVLQFTFMDLAARTTLPPDQAWLAFTKSALSLWAFLMLPLFVTLESALLAGLEHANQQWRHLLALPLPKGVHYLAKQFALMALLALAMVAMFLLVPLGGWLLAPLQPAFGIAGPPPWGYLASSIAACYAASLLIVSLHTWASLRWRSFTVAVAIGMTATVIGFLMMQSSKFGPFYPWAMPVKVFAGEGRHLAFVVQAGGIGGVLVALAGLWGFTRRESA